MDEVAAAASSLVEGTWLNTAPTDDDPIGTTPSMSHRLATAGRAAVVFGVVLVAVSVSCRQPPPGVLGLLVLAVGLALWARTSVRGSGRPSCCERPEAIGPHAPS